MPAPTTQVKPKDKPRECHTRQEICKDVLQKEIYRQKLSKNDASWLYKKLYGEDMVFKESRRGWCIEDRLAAKPARTWFIKHLASAYPGTFTQEDIVKFTH